MKEKRLKDTYLIVSREKKIKKIKRNDEKRTD